MINLVAKSPGPSGPTVLRTRHRLSDTLGRMGRDYLKASIVFFSLVATGRAGAQVPPGAPPPLPPSGPPPGSPPVYAPSPYGQPAYPPAQAAPPQAPPGWAPPGYATAPAVDYRYPPTPMELRYVEGRPIPAGYHVETRPRKGLVISGSIIFGVPYFLSLSVAASSKTDADRWLYAPLVGPFIDLGNRKETCDFGVNTNGGRNAYCSDDSSVRFFLMTDGLMQAAGATMLILGFALPQRLLVRDDAPFVGSSRSHFAWSIAPRMMGRSGYGLGLGGTF
jgi:hypothetical protein